jgi:anaerobic ribonucleoside-triphosphate reductase activating protein
MLNLAGIEENSIVDGEGMRYAIFVQGCPHHCEGCHNPSTWDFKDNIQKDISEIINYIKDDFLCSGVTFSG